MEIKRQEPRELTKSTTFEDVGSSSSLKRYYRTAWPLGYTSAHVAARLWLRVANKLRGRCDAYLGHRNIQHTVRYTELSPGRFKDFGDRRANMRRREVVAGAGAAAGGRSLTSTIRDRTHWRECQGV